MKPLADLLVFIGVCAMLTGSIPPEFERVFTKRWRRMLATDEPAPEPDLTVGPEPAQGDMERARQWGYNNSLLESQIVDLASEFAAVRAEEREP